MLSGGAGDDVIYGGLFDVVMGGEGADTLYGAGTLSYQDATSGVIINSLTFTTGGGAAGDVIGSFNAVIGSDFDDVLTGGFGTVTLYGGAGNDTLTGWNSNDTLYGGAGDDIIDGKIGTDTVSYADATAGVLVNLGITTAQDTIGAGVDQITNMDYLVGSAYDDVLTGNDGANYLFGGAGDDKLQGGLGVNVLYGGDGNDTVTYFDASGPIIASLSTGGAWGTGGGSGGGGRDTYMSIENITGSAYDDQLTGNGGNNILTGGGGNDTLNGGLGDDLLYGGAGIDTASFAGLGSGVTASLSTGLASGAGGTDTLVSIENLTGTSYDDTLSGDAGDNVLSGGAGNDQLDGGAGNDRLDGGAGTDTASYATATSGVTVSLALTTAQNTIGAGTDTLVSIENLTGSAFDDVLTGNVGKNVLSGGDGNDLIDGGTGSGADTLYGGNGTDTLSYASATAKVIVSLAVTSSQATGGAGNDTISGFENLIGSSFNDTLSGDANANIIYGGAGNDLIKGGGGADTLYGGAGDDTLTIVSTDGATVDGGAGNDLVSFAGLASAVSVTVEAGTGIAHATGGAGNVTMTSIEGLIGTDFADYLSGDGGNNSLYGGAGNDVIDGRGGNDVIDGGAGIDTIYYNHAASGVTVNLGVAFSQNTGGAGTELIQNVESLYGSDYNDVFTGNQYSNTLIGSLGDDTLNGGLGNDFLYGGDGTDTASYSNAAGAVRVSLAITTAQSTISAGTDTLSGIENLTGGAYDDQLTGDAGNNVLTGNAGNDTLIGGLGDDHLIGGAGIDTASYAAAASAVTVNLALTTAQDTHGAGFDTFSSIENVIGSAYDDVITGSAQVNALYGGAGNDTLDGGSSNDTLDGGAGNDVLKGGSGNDLIYGSAGNDIIDGGASDLVGDTLSYVNATAGVTVDLRITSAQNVGGGQGMDTITGIENLVGSNFNDTLTASQYAGTSYYGGGGNDVIYGHSAHDILYGGDGNDVLYGGMSDTMFGGAGDDRFVALGATNAASANTIGDFAAGDILDVSAIDADSTVAGDQSFHIVTGFTHAAGEATVTFDAGTNVTTAAFDTDGDGAANTVILFTGDVTALTGTWVL